MTGQDAEWTVALQDLVSRALDGTLPEGTDEFREEFFSTLDIKLDTTAAGKGNRASASVAFVASVASVGSNKKKKKKSSSKQKMNGALTKPISSEPWITKAEVKIQNKGKKTKDCIKSDDACEIFQERYKELRILVDVKLRKLNTEIINRYRSHRFIYAIYKLVKKGMDDQQSEQEDEDEDEDEEEVDKDGFSKGAGSVDMDKQDDTEHGGPKRCCVCSGFMERKNLAVLSCCGHIGHQRCVEESVSKNQTCGFTLLATPTRQKKGRSSKGASSSSSSSSSGSSNSSPLACSVNASAADIIPVANLGCRRDLPKKHLGASPSGKHGAKVTALIHLIQTLLIEEDSEREDKGDTRIVLFVQYSDLMHSMRDILISEGIPTIAIEGRSTSEIIKADKAISGFKDRHLSGWSERVLILNSSDVSASGVTLVRANHIIFLHPLYAETQHEFDAKERQAVGRVRRPGQERDIHLYRFYIEHSLDHDILMERQWNDLDRYSELTQIHASDVVTMNAGSLSRPKGWGADTAGGIVPRKFAEFYVCSSLGKNQTPMENPRKPTKNTKVKRSLGKKRTPSSSSSFSSSSSSRGSKNRKNRQASCEEDEDAQMIGKEKEKGSKSKRKRGGGSKGGGKRKSFRDKPLVSYVAKEEDY